MRLCGFPSALQGSLRDGLSREARDLVQCLYARLVRNLKTVVVSELQCARVSGVKHVWE